MSSGSSKESRRSSAERREAASALRRQQADAERRRRTLIAGGGVLVVLIIIGVLVGIGLSQSNKNTSGPSTAFNGTVTAPAASVVDAVGAGGSSVTLRPKAITAPPLTENGKPRIVYIGAEWCPYCAAQRWVIADTLARFGTFRNLGETQSASNDVDPNTHTLTFHGSTYTSDYLVFSGNEIEDNQRQPLDKLSAADQSVFTTYDTQAYTGTNGGFPFMDIGGTYLLPGAMYDPGLLQGLTQKQILAAMKDANSPVAQAIIGSSNALTATICKLTDNKPANVCTAAGVRAAAGG